MSPAPHNPATNRFIILPLSSTKMVWAFVALLGNKDETEVFALLHSGLLPVIVGFEETTDYPSSIGSRVVTSFHGYSSEPKSAADTIEDLIFEAFDATWDPAFAEAIKYDSIFWISSERGGRLVGELVRETTRYSKYLACLKPASQLLPKGSSGIEFVYYEDIFYEAWMESRGGLKKVEVQGERSVYKGLSFYQFLTWHYESFEQNLNVFYHELETITSVIQGHPNIIGPPKYLAIPTPTAVAGTKDPLVCGMVYPYFKKGSIRGVIEADLISLAQKAKWCLQICSAMHHVHSRAHSFHMDLNPNNILLGDDKNIVIIDWEQCRTDEHTVAPEADGAFDVVEKDGRLVYSWYRGPERKNNDMGSPEWSVYPVWAKECPRAVEMVEVYSLGFVMWALSAEKDLDDYSMAYASDIYSDITEWLRADDDESRTRTPKSWKKLISRCVRLDPNERVPMAELVQFWEGVVESVD